MKTLNTAVIGVGNMGSAHVACIGDGKINGMKLYAVCDIRRDVLDEVTKKYDCITYEKWQDVVNDSNIDAVVIAVPHPLHADMALINGYKVDKAGNVWYKGTAHNFNSIMATAADLVICEADQVVEIGEIEPENVMTQGIFVDYIVDGGKL